MEVFRKSREILDGEGNVIKLTKNQRPQQLEKEKPLILSPNKIITHASEHKPDPPAEQNHCFNQ